MRNPDPRHHGMIFQGWSINTIIAGRKTQTRRLMNPQPVLAHDLSAWDWKPKGKWNGAISIDKKTWNVTPPAAPGDLIWAREVYGFNSTGGLLVDPCITYKADGFQRNIFPEKDEVYKVYMREHLDRMKQGAWRSPLFMPKWAARIWLEVLSVRPEQLQDISEGDIKAEGVYSQVMRASPPLHTEILWVAPGVKMTGVYGEKEMDVPCHTSARRAFSVLWDSINAKRGHFWESDPWVWRYEFIHRNDTMNRLLRRKKGRQNVTVRELRQGQKTLFEGGK